MEELTTFEFFIYIYIKAFIVSMVFWSMSLLLIPETVKKTHVLLMVYHIIISSVFWPITFTVLSLQW